MSTKTILLSIIVILASLTNIINSQSINPSVFQGIVGRVWYVGGAISKFHQANGINTTSKNLGTWNGTTWGTLGGISPNGQVNAIELDFCKNVYVGGAMTAIGDIQMPAARWNFKNRAWQRIGATGSITFDAGAVIHDVQVNCRNFPKSIDCPCSVYLVGKFTATIAGQTVKAVNVVKYEYSKNAWDALGGAAGHSMDSGIIKQVYTKQFGTTGAINIVWFGGSFTNKLQRYDISSKKWGFSSPSNVNGKINGNVNSMFYKIEEGTSTDRLYFGGEFTGLAAEGGTCNGICYFDYKLEKFYAVGTGNLPIGNVATIGININDVTIGGSFNNSASKYISKLINGQPTWATLSATDATQIKTPVYSVDICSKTQNLQFDCEGGSTAVTGKDFGRYYDSKAKTWADFGKGFTGTGVVVTSQLSSAKSNAAIGSIAFIISTMFALFLF